MLPLVIRNKTHLLGDGQPEYHKLYIRKEEYDDGSSVLVSLWEPTPKELAVLNAGGRVRLHIHGSKHPPVKLDVEEPPRAQDR